MNFLETVSAMGDSIMIPINRIRYISIRYINGWEIHIVGDNEMDLSECFGENEEKATKRYNRIRNIIEGG